MPDETNITESAMVERIETTRSELRQVEQSLAALPDRKAEVLSADTFDEKALAKVETEEASLVRKREYLAARSPVIPETNG